MIESVIHTFHPIEYSFLQWMMSQLPKPVDSRVVHFP